MDYANIPTGPRLMPPIFTPRHPRLNQTNHWQPSLLADPGGFQVFHHQQLNKTQSKVRCGHDPHQQTTDHSYPHSSHSPAFGNWSHPVSRPTSFQNPHHPVSTQMTIINHRSSSRTTTGSAIIKKRTHPSSLNDHASSNWKNIQSKLPKIPASVKAKQDRKRQLKLPTSLTQPSPHDDQAHDLGSQDEFNDPVSLALHHILQKGVEGMPTAKKAEIGKYLAIDCEMVGVGPNGIESVLARVSIVNYYGVVLYDSYVAPKEKVTDYRTWVSGIKPEHLINAKTFGEVTAKVAQLIKDKILIGHAITNDLQALLLKHPRPLLRDTSTYQPLRTLAKTKFPSLKKLSALLLNVEIQASSHSSVDDARATMAVYRTQKDVWESSLRSLINSSTAPLFRPQSRQTPVLKTTRRSPSPLIASSSKPSSIDAQGTDVKRVKGTSPPPSTKVEVISITKADVIEIPDDSEGETQPMSKKKATNTKLGSQNCTSPKSTSKASHRGTSPPASASTASQKSPSAAAVPARATSPEFKKPRTSNLRLSATLQHIRNEEEVVAAQQSLDAGRSQCDKTPSQKTGLNVTSAQRKNEARSEHRQPPSQTSRHHATHPYARKPQPGNPSGTRHQTIGQRPAGGVKGVREYGTEVIGVVRKSGLNQAPPRNQATSALAIHPAPRSQSTKSTGWWDA